MPPSAVLLHAVSEICLSHHQGTRGATTGVEGLVSRWLHELSGIAAERAALDRDHLAMEVLNKGNLAPIDEDTRR